MINEIEEEIIILENAIKHFPFDIDTSFPEMENILSHRDYLEENKGLLSASQLAFLSKVDSKLLKYKNEISKLADIKTERKRLNIPRSHWWWYADKLTDKKSA